MIEDVDRGTNRLQDKIARLKEQRLHRESLDMVEMIELYPEPLRILILNRIKQFEITDGCTGGCPWCAFNVQRHIRAGFSFESIESFLKNMEYIYLYRSVFFGLLIREI